MFALFVTLITIVTPGSTEFTYQDGALSAEVKAYLLKVGEIKDEHQATIHISNLLSGDSYQGKDGMYSFSVLGSHHVPYLGYQLNGKVFLLERYNVKEVLKWYLGYVQKNTAISPQEKYILLSNIAKVMESRTRIQEGLEAPNEFRY
jgi:hypothetical protein